ncbi:response regulator [Cognaticolwellia mytili]|uniref:response regulator n=1 Tax=Cognaticolwellia mytili TaxID=1888913 RepID=UPI000A16E030|nr:response regulator [Cognaticolwellia mytili]
MEVNDLDTDILIIDDSATNIRVVSNIIQPLGCKIFAAKSGPQALSLLTSFKPSLIILDIQMPEMNGFECCKRIKSVASRTDIPIVFLSGSHDEADQLQASDLGASAYLTKPFCADELISVVKRFA